MFIVLLPFPECVTIVAAIIVDPREVVQMSVTVGEFVDIFNEHGFVVVFLLFFIAQKILDEI